MIEKSKTEGALVELWSETLGSETPGNVSEFLDWMRNPANPDAEIKAAVERCWLPLLQAHKRSH